MKYSFVIPVYRGKILLKNTLEALNHLQGYDRNGYEVVVVDDGSGDDTVSYIKGINRNYHLKYLYLERDDASCRARARNQGWKNAAGEIVIFIDADILVKADFLRELDRCYALNPDLLVIGLRLMLPEPVDVTKIRDQSVFDEYRFDRERFSMLEARHFAFERFGYNAAILYHPWLFVYSSNMAVPRRRLEEMGGFDENFKGWGLEDNELGYRLYQSGVKIVINSRLEVLHQFHGPKNELHLSGNQNTEYQHNFSYFLAKHSDVFHYPREIIYRIFHGEIGDGFFIPEGGLFRKVIKQTNRDDLERIQRAIVSGSGRKGIALTVMDYGENTDLDLWIQLTEELQRPPRYYPVTKKLRFWPMLNYMAERRYGPSPNLWNRMARLVRLLILR